VAGESRLRLWITGAPAGLRRVVHCAIEQQINVRNVMAEKNIGILSRMSASHRNTPARPVDEVRLTAKQRKTVPHEFVLEALAALLPGTRPMFGCVAVYVEEKIVLILRDRREGTADNGVWLATTEAHHESLRRQFPNSRRCAGFRGSGATRMRTDRGQRSSNRQDPEGAKAVRIRRR